MCELNSLKRNGGDILNYSEFRAAIARTGISNKVIAEKLGLSEQAFYNKMSGRSEFKNSEIVKLSELLGLTMESVNLIFFGGTVN